MPFRSQDLQKICAEFLGTRHVHPNFIRDVEKHNPRLGYLLKKDDKHVFDSDIETLVQFFQKSPFGAEYAKNRYTSPAKIQSQFHDKLREHAIKRELEPRFERRGKKLDIFGRISEARVKAQNTRIQTDDERKKFESLADQQKRILEIAKQQEEIKKRQANIKTARKKTARLERAKSYVENIMQSRQSTLKEKEAGRLTPVKHSSDLDLAI